MAAYRSLQIWVKKGHRMYPYFQNMCQSAKNMHNTTNFFHALTVRKTPTSKKKWKSYLLEWELTDANFLIHSTNNQWGKAKALTD